MENFIEKLKTVDKKVWIGVGIGAAVLIILIVALVIGMGNNKKPVSGNTQGTQAGTETEGGVTEVFGTEVLGTEGLATETTETEMGTETEVAESESQSGNKGQGGSQSGNKGQSQSSEKGETTSNVTVTQNEAVNGAEQKPVTKTEDGKEIFGLGSKDEPYEEIPDLSTMTLTTVEVPAGKTLYYKIQRVGGMYLTINDADAYVITSRGTRHDAKNGKVSFKVENAMANEFVLFQIGNNSSSNKAFTIKFSNPTGSYQNPTKLDSLSATTELPYGSDVGLYYKFVATQGGNIRFYIDSATTSSDISVTNNRNSMNRTFSADVKTDEQGRRYILLEKVAAGDVLMINVCALPDANWEYPAATVVWHGEYVAE